jgi:hypothetical protein
VTEAPSKGAPGAGTWVLIVLVVGVLTGVALAVAAPHAAPPPRAPCQGPGCPAAPSAGSAPAVLDYPHVAVVLTCVALAALLALLIVYATTYRATRSAQMLGLCLFLGALLLEEVLTSPFVFAPFGAVPGGLQPFLIAGQAFECLALLVFLFLGLQ